MASNKYKDNKSIICCAKCIHAKLMQWSNNPIVAYCKIYDERFVAECDRQCKLYQTSGNVNHEVVHFDHYEEGDNF